MGIGGMSLHIIKTDMLLATLGGFADAPPGGMQVNAVPMWVWDEIIRLSRQARVASGELNNLAERSGRSYDNLLVRVHQARRGKLPGYLREYLKNKPGG